METGKVHGSSVVREGGGKSIKQGSDKVRTAGETRQGPAPPRWLEAGKKKCLNCEEKNIVQKAEWSLGEKGKSSVWAGIHLYLMRTD